MFFLKRKRKVGRYSKEKGLPFSLSLRVKICGERGKLTTILCNQ